MINFWLVLRVLAILLGIISMFMLLPIICALVFAETFVLYAFILPIVLILALVLIVLLITRRQRGELSIRDGFLLVTFSWLFSAAVGALPFYISGAIPSFSDAFFESMSGFTTTGASILSDIESLPRAILFWRSLTHWLGGMGIIVLTVAVLPLLGVGGMQLIKAEAPGPTLDKLTPKITETAKILWISYIGLSGLEAILLRFGGMSWFDSLTHTFGTMATGGFSTKNTSIGYYASPYIHIVITVFMILAGINFVLYYKIIRGKIQSIVQDSELRVYLAVFIAASLLMAWSLYGSTFSSFGKSLRYAAFQTASILTTTGYATDDFALWPTFAQGILFVMMWIGGCSGSTGGGIKVRRILTVIKQGWNEMRYLLYPNGVFFIRFNGMPMRKKAVYYITGFVFLYILLIILTCLVTAAAGNDLLTSFTTALATLGNIGPGFNAVGPTQNYGFYPSWLKVFLSFIMMVGRLEIYTVLILFTVRFRNYH